MPASKRKKPLYERGGYKLFRREDRKALEIIWYDDARKRERSSSAGTEDLEEAKSAVDRLYMEHTKGHAFCPTCGQRRSSGSVFVTTAIADYLTLVTEKPSYQAIRARLMHVLAYLLEKEMATVLCESIDDAWITRFRSWLLQQPIISPTGIERSRALSTAENSILQLAAAINQCSGASAKFRPIQPKNVNRTPRHRSSVAELAEMFRHCINPAPGKQPVDRARRDRLALLAFLRISVVTLARPDAALEASTDPHKRQWNSKTRIFDLNPDRRPQTRKYRAIVPIGERMASILDETFGNVVPAQSVRSAWETMARALNLPTDGEAGTKLIRRSMATIIRGRVPEEAWGELEVFLGHARFNEVSELYAPFEPHYLGRILVEIDRVVAEIDALVPGAFPLPAPSSA
jgi:hypothetical protein